jgi:hypothetical protein
MSERNYVSEAPIVFERRKKKKGAAARRDARQSERYLLKAMERSIRAADKGVAKYRKERKKSRRKSRDEVVISMVPNLIKGSSSALKALSLVPYDLLRATYTRSTRRAIRSTFRSSARVTDDLLR